MILHYFGACFDKCAFNRIKKGTVEEAGDCTLKGAIRANGNSFVSSKISVKNVIAKLHEQQTCGKDTLFLGTSQRKVRFDACQLYGTIKEEYEIASQQILGTTATSGHNLIPLMQKFFVSEESEIQFEPRILTAAQVARDVRPYVSVGRTQITGGFFVF